MLASAGWSSGKKCDGAAIPPSTHAATRDSFEVDIKGNAEAVVPYIKPSKMENMQVEVVVRVD